jgi:phosphoenolpyruvate-protein kinase (PTS system EI component)
MLEIPSAILTVASFLDRVSFVSLGTNDLLQYTLAVDRGNPELERYRDPLHPAVLNLIRTAVGAGNRAGVDVSVCGEMAGDPIGALVLVGLGIRSLSMAPLSIPAVRRAIRSAAFDDLRQGAQRSLDAATAAEARSRFLSIHQDD